MVCYLNDMGKLMVEQEVVVEVLVCIVCDGLTVNG